MEFHTSEQHIQYILRSVSQLQVNVNLDPVDYMELWAVANHALRPAVTLWVCIAKKLLSH